MSGGVICNSEASLNHHYDSLKPDFVLDVKDMPNEEIGMSLSFANGNRTVVVTQLTSEKGNILLKISSLYLWAKKLPICILILTILFMEWMHL